MSFPDEGFIDFSNAGFVGIESIRIRNFRDLSRPKTDAGEYLRVAFIRRDKRQYMMFSVPSEPAERLRGKFGSLAAGCHPGARPRHFHLHSAEAP